jgi:cell division protein ZapE
MNKITPQQRYYKTISDKKLIADPLQEQAVIATQELYESLIANARNSTSFSARIWRKLLGKPSGPCKGIYFWGGVGTGKTCVVDNFFESLPFDEKLRIHFHRFMQRIHGELKELKNVKDPLQIVASNLAERTRVVCFDEFQVNDITDAMLLSGLLSALFERDIVLVTTSNQHPDSLYHDGLQRPRFLPAIELLKRHTRVINLDSGIDYRLKYLDTAEIYHYPLDDRAKEMMLTNFTHIAPNEGVINSTIEIENRKIQTIGLADGVVWFDFVKICGGPRGPADYIEIARQFQTVLIANVPCMGVDEENEAKRFITLVDEFYDRNVKLIITAEAGPEHLYRGKRLEFDFKRTQSRLVEMQSHQYLARQHLTD